VERLVQREQELATIDALLDGASDGEGAVALVEGPAGIGKTALVRAARERAAARGLRVLSAVGTEFEREYPLGVARQWLEPVVRSGGERLLHGPATLAEPVLRGVPEPVEAAPVGLLHGLYWLVVNLAEESPVLLAVDDAQWADEPSLRFLGYLARRLEALPVAVLVGARTEDARPSPLDELRPAATRIEPPALDREGVQELLAPVDERFARACHAATGGNPFLLDELVRALRAAGVPFTADASARVGTVAPPTVARTVAGTLERAGPGPAALARAASILGDGAALDLAAALAGLDMSDASAAAAELVRVGLLEDATALRFRHPVLAGAVRAGLAAPERAAAHARAVELLRARGAGPERVALQLLHASPTGDQNVVDELRTAAVRAGERGAPATAAVLLRRALAEPPAPNRRAAVLVELGQAELSTGEGASADAHLEEAHRSAEEAVTRARALLLRAEAVPGEASARRRLAELIEAALPEAERQDRDLALRLRAVLVLDSPNEAPEVPGDTPAEVVYLSHLVFARMVPGARAADVADLALRAAAHPDALLEEGPYVLAFTGTVLGLRWSDRLDDAERLVERAIAVARRRGSNSDFAIAMTHRAALARRAGRLRDAEADARTALGALLDQRWSFARGVVPLVGTLLNQGRTDDARAALAEAVGDGEIAEAPPLTQLVLVRMALWAARGDTGAALRDWEDAMRRASRMRGVNAGWMEDLEVAVGVYAALDQPDEAAATAAQACALARAWDTPGALGHARGAQARIAASDTERVELLREAVEHFAQSPARYHDARARVNLGATLRRLGHRVQSREPLRHGYELATRCGADGLAETARAELRASGIRLRHRAVTGADALTPSERRIADMAAGGQSNPEIAQELFLTVKTVEMHLTHAYRKLDIRGRAELEDALAAKP
jgi:DNA-binding CsgD family transcriptional regulator